MDSVNEVHPNCIILQNLLGKWTGTGKGFFPQIAEFEYNEVIEFRHNGKQPNFSYTQQTSNPSGKPLHSENGFLRIFPDNCVEFLATHGVGLAEIEFGVVTSFPGETKIETTTNESSIVAGARNKPPKTTKITRKWILTGDTLKYKVFMATDLVPNLTQHLECTLKRELP